MLSQGRIDFNQQTKKIISKKKKFVPTVSNAPKIPVFFFVIVPLDAAIRHNSPI